jgi:hypothetical protein
VEVLREEVARAEADEPLVVGSQTRGRNRAHHRDDCGIRAGRRAVLRF